MTPPTRLGTAVARAALLSAVLTGVVSLAVAAGGSPPTTDPAPLTPPTPAAALRVDDLISAHDCWSGEAPDPTVIPGKAVVTLPGKDPALVPADVGFEIWLEGRAGTLHAFCP